MSLRDDVQAQIISAVLIYNRRPVFPPEAPRDYAVRASPSKYP